MLADPLALTLAACLAFYLYALWRSLAGDQRFALYGPAVLLRCSRCASIVRVLASKSPLPVAWLGVAAWLIGMILGFAMLVESAVVSLSLPPEQAPSPAMLVALPGINPLIPLWYGLLGLAVAIVVHELAHGLVLAANGFPAKTAGIVLLGVPLGAFVEPPDEFQGAEPKVKVKVFSAGPFANFATALLALLLLSYTMVDVSPVARGVGVTGVLEGSPAALAGIRPGSVIVAVNGSRVTSLEEFLAIMSRARAGSTVELAFSDGRTVKLTLADKYAFTKQEGDRGKGFIGVSLMDLEALLNGISISIDPYSPLTTLRKTLLIPFSMNPSALPYLKSFYRQPKGGWELAYALAWIAWINLAAGLSNALPILPLDGGSALKVVLEAVLKVVPPPLRKKITEAIALSLTFVSVALILVPVVVPRLRAFIGG